MFDALKQGIRDEHGDDAPRLALADWLEEQDDPRAELIRLQTHAPPDANAAQQWLNENRGLLFFHAVDSIDEPPPNLALQAAGYEASPPINTNAQSLAVYDRGMIRDLHYTVTSEVRDNVLVEGRKFVRSVLENHPVKHLSLRRNLATHCKDRDIQTLLANLPACPSLRELCVHNFRIDAATLRMLADSDLMKNPHHIAHLDLKNTAPDHGEPHAVAAMLAQMPCFAGLQGLSMDSCFAGDQAVLALIQSPHMRELEQLNFSANRLTDISMERLAAGGLPKLNELRVEGNATTEAGARMLAQSTELKALQHVYIGTTIQGDAQAQALAQEVGQQWRNGIAALPALESINGQALQDINVQLEGETEPVTLAFLKRWLGYMQRHPGIAGTAPGGPT